MLQTAPHPRPGLPVPDPTSPFALWRCNSDAYHGMRARVCAWERVRACDGISRSSQAASLSTTAAETPTIR
eukprot:2625942-Rhodomonas_salina.1